MSYLNVCEITESCPIGSQSSYNAAFEDTVTITCFINYRGSAVPVLQWSPGSRTSPTNCSSSGTVCSSLSVNIQPGMRTVESQSCSVMFPATVYPQCSGWNSTKFTVSCTQFI